MAEQIEDDGPAATASSSYFSKAATSLGSSRPANQPNLDRQNGTAAFSKTGVVQPRPQALPRRTGPASIIVSPRQKGNPVLEKIKSMPWEYGDIPADYVLGLTICALFLSLKYHRLHPEYIYGRIKALQGKYNLRIILCMVDIQNHEDALKELSKTSVINNVTIILCWSAAEGARYLELFKTYENAAPTSIKQHQSTTYSDRMVDFVTTPRAINKTDAVSLVSQFGTIRTAVNAPHEEVSTIAGWGEKKVQQWCTSVREPFRVQRTAKRGLDLESLAIASQPVSRAPTLSRDVTRGSPARASRLSSVLRDDDATTAQTAILPDFGRRASSALPEEALDDHDFADDEEVLADTLTTPSLPARKQQKGSAEVDAIEPRQKRKCQEDPLSDGVMAALSKLRKF